MPAFRHGPASGVQLISHHMRELTVGEKLDQYRITDLLARSGMASIFLAADELSLQRVVLKVPYAQFEKDLVFHGRFVREERVGQRLEHPNLVKILTPVRKSRLYIAMEFVDGQSLRALMRGGRQIEEAKALNYARQLGEALVYIHGQGGWSIATSSRKTCWSRPPRRSRSWISESRSINSQSA